MVSMSRKLIGVVLIVVIIFGCIFLWTKKDEFFNSEIIITYSDGCIEKYINTELITPICEEGRRLELDTSRGPGYFPDTII